jgi:hypothetical protein
MIKAAGWAGISGLLLFCICFGQVLDPNNLNWLLQNHNQDAVQHLVGWEFFRHEPWHFPLGKITHYGAPLDTSIVYTDSIPLLALLFKPFAPLLPLKFQYFGLWYALCAFLQGWFGYQLIRTYSTNAILCFLGSSFFLVSPIMLNRLLAHHALVAHWLLLAGLYLYAQAPASKRKWYWVGLMCLSVLIHAYFTPMLSVLWVATLSKNYATYTWRELISEISFIFLGVSSIAWLSGYFVGHFHLAAGGFQFNSLNLLAPILPSSGNFISPGNWSRFLPELAVRWVEQGDEGFNYFGLGVIVLLVLSLGTWLRKPTCSKFWWPLIASCLLLTCFALSNEVWCGNTLLWHYEIPPLLTPLTSTFRAAGRFFWPGYYVLLYWGLRQLITHWDWRWVMIVLIACLSLQAWDVSQKVSDINQVWATVEPDLVSARLEHALSPTMGSLVFIPAVRSPHKVIPNFKDYVYFAATHGLKINVGYFARAPELAESVNLNRHDPQALYISLPKKPFVASIHH